MLTAPGLLAQAASPYVPLDHWTMPFVEQLIAADVLRDPTPLTRPFKRADLVRALDEVDTLTEGPAVRAVVRRLRRAYASEETGPRYRVDGNVGLSAASYMKRDPLAAIDSSGPRGSGPAHGTENAGLDLEFLVGPVAAVTHPYFDTRLKYDPDWFGKKDRVVAGRAEESYLSAQWHIGEVFFGRLDRNWGPSGIQGLLLSDNPYGPDHLGVTLGTARFQFQAVAMQLDSRPDSSGALVRRYMIQHRLWIKPSSAWTVALWESTSLEGPGRTPELWYLNILNLGILERWNNGGTVDEDEGLDVERHGAITLYGQFLLDDIQVDRKSPGDLKPTSYGFTLGAKGALRSQAIAWTLFYTQVANLIYRNTDSLENPLYHALGTGRNFDDYDQATLKLGFLFKPGVLLQPEVTLLRQGQGDPRLPFPPVSAYPTTPVIFQGVVERTLRLALSGTCAPSARLGLTFDAGLDHVTNFQHVTGDTRTQFIGSVGLSYRFGWEGPLP